MTRRFHPEEGVRSATSLVRPEPTVLSLLEYRSAAAELAESLVEGVGELVRRGCVGDLRHRIAGLAVLTAGLEAMGGD